MTIRRFALIRKGANKLPAHKRVMILNTLVEGIYMRAISRRVGVSIDIVTKLMVGAGEACAEYQNKTVSNVKAKAAPNGTGDVWTWTVLDSDSKMILSWEVGDCSSLNPQGVDSE